MLVKWLAGAFPDSPQSQVISPNTSVQYSSHLPHLRVAHAGVLLPLPSPTPPPPPRQGPLSHIMVLPPKPGAVPCIGIGTRCIFVELDGGEWGWDFTGSQDHLSLCYSPAAAAARCSGPEEGQDLEASFQGSGRGVLMASWGPGCFMMIFPGQW